MRQVQDHILLRQAIRKGDRKALAVLHNKYYPQVRCYITSRLAPRADADDLAQNVFVELLRGNGQYDGQADAQAYLFGIASNIVGRYYRDKRSRLNAVHMDTVDQIPDSRAVEPSGELIQRQQIQEVIAHAVAQLPPKARQAIKLRFIDGLSSKQAAKKAGCSLKTFYSRIYEGIQALGKLRDVLDGEH